MAVGEEKRNDCRGGIGEGLSGRDRGTAVEEGDALGEN